MPVANASAVSCSSVRRPVLRLSRRRLLLLPTPARRRHVGGVRLQSLPVCRHQGVRHGRSLGGGAAALHRRRNEAATSQEIRRERSRLVDVTSQCSAFSKCYVILYEQCFLCIG